MKPAETIRFSCGDCQAVFDICLAPQSECAEHFDDADFFEALDIDPTNCPLCGAREHKALHDRPVKA